MQDGEVQLTELESEVQRKAVLIQSCLNLMTSLVIPQGPGLPSSEQVSFYLLCCLKANAAIPGPVVPGPWGRELSE